MNEYNEINKKKFKNKYIVIVIYIQEHSDLNWAIEVWSFLFYQINYTPYVFTYIIKLNYINNKKGDLQDLNLYFND